MRKFYKLLYLLPLLLFASCTAPIGAQKSSMRNTYAQIEANALSTDKPSSETAFLLGRYDLDKVFAKNPEECVRQLHAKAIATDDRDLLFALAETSYLTGKQAEKNVRPWDRTDPRDYYLGAAIYAYLFLFGDQKSPAVTSYDRRFRIACDLYNYSLGLAFTKPKDTNAIVQLGNPKRRLPVGEVEIALDTSNLPGRPGEFQEFVMADQFRVRGLSVRNRQPGVGATLIAVRSRELGAGIRMMSAATAFLRFQGSLKQLGSETCHAKLEMHSAFGPGTVQIGGQTVPLETDMSVQLAYGLNQSAAWRIEKLQFFSLQELIPTGVYLSQPYKPGRIPVVFVHGTFSSPVWWAEMLNTLRADPELRQKYQFWFFIYNSSAPVLVSSAKLRTSLVAKLKELDPDGTDTALQQMVVIGHSQGGLLTKLTATDTGDKLWRAISDKPVEEMGLTDEQVALAHQLFFIKPMACVRRVVFISTPHRGSYRAGGFVQTVTRWFISIPRNLSKRAEELVTVSKKLKLPVAIPTSIDGMSTKSPILKALAEIPVAPEIKANSIIPVQGDGEITDGDDGVVKYQSAHIDYGESELVVRYGHSCQSTPAAIEEVRRILHLHFDQKSQSSTGQVAAKSQARQTQ